MRIIKLGLISLVFFAIFLTLFSLIFPSHIRVSKAVDIRSSKDSLLNKLNNPVSWKSWYPGADSAEMIPNGIRTKEGNELSITGISDSLITTTFRNKISKTGRGGWRIMQGSSPGTYTIQWYMDFHLRWYPWEKFSGLLLENRYGPMMETGLEKLKTLLSVGAPLEENNVNGN